MIYGNVDEFADARKQINKQKEHKQQQKQDSLLLKRNEKEKINLPKVIHSKSNNQGCRQQVEHFTLMTDGTLYNK